jgi:hypothetical protein
MKEEVVKSFAVRGFHKNLIMMELDYVSELRKPTGLLLIPRVMYEHGQAMVMMMTAEDNS